MDESKIYSLDHAISRVELKLMPGRLLVNTQGKGALDRPRTIDIAPSDLEHFTVVPAIQAQHIVHGRRLDNAVIDDSFDSVFIFTYRDKNKRKNKRVFVKNEAPEFQEFLMALERVRPDATLRRLDPADALRQMNLLSASTVVKIVVGLIILMPILAMTLAQIFR